MLLSSSAEDRATQGGDPSAHRAADTPEMFNTSGPQSVCLNALNPGVAGAKLDFGHL
jgi:hypothetical protein